MHNSNRVTFLDTHSAPRYNLAAPLANRDLPKRASTLRWPYHLRLYYAAKSAPRKHATPKQHPLVLLHQPLGRHQPLVEHLVYFLAQFCLKLGNALAVIFLRVGQGRPARPACRDFPRCQELFRSQANRHDLGKKVQIFGMHQNPVSPCLLFATF